MNSSRNTPTVSTDQIENCVRHLDVIQSLSELMAVANAADALGDAIVTNPKLLTAAWDGIGLLAENAKMALAPDVQSQAPNRRF